VIGTAEDQRVGWRQVLLVAVPDGVEQRRGARVLAGIEQRRGEELAHPKLQCRVLGALDAVFEQTDRLGRVVSVQHLLGGGPQLLGFGVA
jgi:hypothetical protein